MTTKADKTHAAALEAFESLRKTIEVQRVVCERLQDYRGAALMGDMMRAVDRTERQYVDARGAK